MPKKNALLWEIQFQNKFKGYVFGSMHVPGNLAFDNLEKIYQAIDNCEVIATEIPLDKESQFEMGKHMHLPSSVSLRNLFTEKKYTKFEKILEKSFNLHIEQFDDVLPLFLLNYMTQIAINADPKNLSNSMDLEFWKYAKISNKKTDSVETLKDHIETLYQIPLEYQLKALSQALSNVSKFRKKSIKMLDLYKSQEIHKLYAQSKKSLSGIREVLLYRRNKIMVENVNRICQESTGFFIVGAGHLSGKTGLLHQLKILDYKVKPVKI